MIKNGCSGVILNIITMMKEIINKIESSNIKSYNIAPNRRARDTGSTVY